MSAIPLTPDFPELSVQNFAACEVRKGLRLVGAPVDGDTIYLVLAGTMHMRVPGEKVAAPTGSLVLVPRGIQPAIAPRAGQSIDVIATRNCLIQRGGLLVFDAAEGGAGDLRVLVGRVAGDLAAALGEPGEAARPLVVDLTTFPLAQSVYAALLAELENPQPGLASLSAALMKACLLLFVRDVRARAAAPETIRLPSTSRLAGVVAAIMARPAEKHSLDRLAALAGMSRATFARRFVDVTGTSPMEFVLKARLQEAAAMLRATDQPIKQIAAETGFLSRSHFSRAFVATFGTNPTDFRAEHRPGSDPAIVEAPASADELAAISD